MAQLQLAWILCAIFFAVLPIGPSRADGPPVAKVATVTDSYFGTTIDDPYRWMETPSPGFSQWLLDQSNYTGRILEGIPARLALKQRLMDLSRSEGDVTRAMFVGNRWIFEKTSKGQDVAKLMLRSADGVERVLVNPSAFDKGRAHASISFWTPSWNGRFIAYGISVGGAETGVTRILDVATGRNLSDRIERTFGPRPAWLPDSSGFYYTALSPGSAKPDIESGLIVLHKLGSDPQRERAILGVGVESSLPISRGIIPFAITAPDSSYIMIGVSADLITDNITLYVAPLASVHGTQTKWQSISSDADQVRKVALHGDNAYLAVASGAPLLKVIKVGLERPDIRQAEVVIPQGLALIRDIQPASDALYLREVVGGPGKVVRVPWNGEVPSDVPLLGADGITFGGFAAFSNEPGVVIVGQSWIHSRTVLRYDPDKRMSSNIRLLDPDRVNFSDVAVDEVSVEAKDGALIPLTIIHPKDLTMDGRNPTILMGYGAYGDVRVPYYDRMRRAWFDHGGIYAVAHVRGGGELGEPWHAAGALANKVNSISDFISCAEFLIGKGYSSPDHLAGEGTSAGGIVIGGAVTGRPDLFRAALMTVGMLNTLRLEQIPIGRSNVVEFGSIGTADGFRMLLADDAYQHIKVGVAYPAVLLSTGLNDARVPPWQSGKMAARLQSATSSGHPVLLRVDEQAGHLGGGTRSMEVDALTDQWAFLLWQLGVPEFQPNPH
jgi:prolyl oligopeptidase